ncbi:uncharacterized protein SPPG_06052 [Spizellomyces punctatus DAOM BR117]|uniref:SAM-dependent methyltransferase n=1 Tax=Spizellomyces punctatus (strain DAOM BR117) TaxID=645134 RepID=A0A0L0HBU0_SPIPD|nr:uncharacterized protein SPPG_06052 [Spizellomyces punctatus DAOM BR117]KNC98344.1 hypothetical protein SPPG_06052 [Spizellomyces punctatus DAOM BR117]|eukprot:XP_016606384.1 hypothetical protein SPPG_06052 [Spizellomyces punctatus DAOM BR117]
MLFIARRLCSSPSRLAAFNIHTRQLTRSSFSLLFSCSGRNMTSTKASNLHAHNMYENVNATPENPRIVYPYAERNKDPILETISPYLQRATRVLELASGSGQHVVHWAQAYPSVHFQPSEIDDPSLLASIRSYVKDFANVAPPLLLNAMQDEHWSQARSLVAQEGAFDMVYMGNVLHIAPWDVTLAVAKNIPTLLPNEQGLFIIYGPFKRDGKFTTPSNEEFDQKLRLRNADWGLRDIADVADQFAKFGLSLQEIKDMPANNFILVFRKMEN